jgi:uncharacterized membrane protein HdeD (DUF308 family)
MKEEPSMEKIKKMKIDYIVEALVMIIVGGILIFWPEVSLTIMARALAVLLTIIGALFIVAFLLKSERGMIDSGKLAVGIIVAAIGVWIFVNPSTFTSFIPKLFGVFILVSGLINLGQTFSLIKLQYPLWWISLILALITLGLGGFLVFKSEMAKELVIKVIGGFLIYDGISNLWTASRVSKFSKAVNRAVKEAEAIDTDAEIIEVNPSKK